MPITTSVLPDLSLVLRIYSGKVTMAELRSAVLQAYAHPDYNNTMAEIDDLMGAESVDIGFAEMMEFAKEAQANYQKRGFMPKHCFLANEKRSDAVVMMYRELSDMIGNTESLFVLHGYPEALAVLDLPPDSIDMLPEACRSEAHLLHP